MTALRAAAVADIFATGLGIEVAVAADAAGTPVVDVPVERWAEAAQLARDVLELDFVDWLSAVDEPEADPAGIDVVLHVADSRAITRRVLLRTRLDAAAPSLPSLTGRWPGVAWHERETHEMFGVLFEDFRDGQAGLRPLLLPEGFEGTPLRKSFVLAARVSKPWPGAKEPGEGGSGAPSRRKARPPGVPDPATWGPHEAGQAEQAGQAGPFEQPGQPGPVTPQ